MLALFGLKDHMLVTGEEQFSHEIDYKAVHERIAKAREESMAFLQKELDLL